MRPLLLIALTVVADTLTPHLQFNRLLGRRRHCAATWPLAGTLIIGLLAIVAAIGLAATYNHDLGGTSSLFTVLAITAITLAAAYASRVRQTGSAPSPTSAP